MSSRLFFGISGGILALFALAILAHIFIFRPWYLSWGATPEETQMALPGDSFIPAGADVTTRAITINAPAAKIWPWMLQIGQERAGFYSYYWLENLFGANMPTRDSSLPQTEPLQVGEMVSMMGDGPPVTKAVVSLIEPEQALSFQGWTLYLKPISPTTTRLIVRYPFDVSSSGMAAYYYGTFEMWHYIMETGMMMGLKQRAEAPQGGN